MYGRETVSLWPPILIILAGILIQACVPWKVDSLKHVDKEHHDLLIVKEDCDRVWLTAGVGPTAPGPPSDLDEALAEGVLKVADRGTGAGPESRYPDLEWLMAVETQGAQSVYTLFRRPEAADGQVPDRREQVKQWTIGRGEALPQVTQCEPGRDYYIATTRDGAHRLHACTWKDEQREDRRWVRIGGCARRKQTQDIRVPFDIRGPHAVPFRLFNVLTPGRILAEVRWTGSSETLRVVLSGRRRPHLAAPTTPYSQMSGSSPIVVTYDATEADLARGVGWRLAVYDDHGPGEAQGTIQITIPFHTELDTAFRAQKISLRSGDHWPSGQLQARFTDALEGAPGQGLHGMVSLTRALSCEEDQLFRRQGLVRQTFLPGRHAFGFVRKGVDLAHPVVAGPLLGITPLDPEDKIDPHILLGNYSRFVAKPDNEPPYNYVLQEDGTLKLCVLFARDTTTEHINRVLRGHASDSEPLSDHLWRATLSPGSLVALAAEDQVEWIEAAPGPTLGENERTRALVHVDGVQNAVINPVAGTITYAGLSGAGITVGVDEDGGVDATHNDLNVAADAAGTGVHGTHVAGTIAASGIQSNRSDDQGNPNNGVFFQWRGMAPEAAIIDSTDLIGTANLLDAIRNNSLDVGNHSHSVDVDGDYSVTAQLIDQEIRGGATSGGIGLPRRAQIYSAGNSGAMAQYGDQRGYFSVTKQIKNGIVCGNWDAGPTGDRLSPSSSMGPMRDGRIKPDLVAPGTEVISTAANGYVSMSGTSISSAVVSGITALLLEAWQETYCTPLGTNIDDTPPYPAALRAVLIQTARDVVDADVRRDHCGDVDSDSNAENGNDGLGNAAATAGPDYATGWGQVDAQAAAELIGNARMEHGTPIPNRIIQDAVRQGGIVQHDFVVNEPGPLRVTLAWDDHEGAPQNPAVNPMLVNDLDLELTAPDGTVYYPWRLGHAIYDAAGNPLADDAQVPGAGIRVRVPITPRAIPTANDDHVPSDALAAGGDWVASPGKDHLNNVEQVFVPNVPAGQMGHWTLRVIGFDIAAGFQAFSVVGFPYPDLAELVVSCDDQIGMDSFDQDISFTWSVSNVGRIPSGDPGDTFEYQILLSDDVYPGDDVLLADSTQALLGPLAVAASVDLESTVQISSADANALLGIPPGDPDATVEDLLARDVFLVVRVDSGDDVLEHNEDNTVAVQLASLVDVVLVLDRSGSMEGEVPVSSGARRKMEVLQSSANLFLDLMRLDAGDRLAEVSFSGGLGPDSITTDFGPAGRLVEIRAENIDEAHDAINALEPGRATDIRRAMQEALDVMATAGEADRRRAIIFFSDGVGTEGGDPTEEAFLQQFGDESIHVYAVGFGSEGGTGYSGIDTHLLQALTNVGDGGFFHVTDSAVGLDKFFTDAVAEVTRSDIILDPIDGIVSGQTHIVDVPVTEQAASVTFILTWDNPLYPLELSVRTPSGVQVHAGNAGSFGGRVTRARADTYEVYRMRLPIAVGPLEDHQGAWQMRISNQTAATVWYSATSMGETGLDLKVQSPTPQGGRAAFAPGDGIPLSAVVSRRDGQPVTAATATVTANVPLVGLGDLLSAMPLTEADLEAVPFELHGEPLSDRERIMLALHSRMGGDLLPRADLATFELLPTESRDTFRGIFGDTSHEGVYRFTTRIEGLADCQPFRREATASASVSTGVDPVATIVAVTPDDGQPGTVVVSVTPVSTSGGYVGPGYASDITIRAGHLDRLTPVTDLFNGSYARRFKIVGYGAAALEVSVLGIKIGTDKLDTSIPTPVAITPSFGNSRYTQLVHVTVSDPADLAEVSGVFFSAEGRHVELEEVRIYPDQGTVQASVPAGLSPGRYTIRLGSDLGLGLTGKRVVYHVIASDGGLPPTVRDLSQQVDGLLVSGSQTNTMRGLGHVLRQLVAMPIGIHLTHEEKRSAALEILELIAQRKVRIQPSDIPAIVSVLENHKREAR